MKQLVNFLSGFLHQHNFYLSAKILMTEHWLADYWIQSMLRKLWQFFFKFSVIKCLKAKESTEVAYSLLTQQPQVQIAAFPKNFQRKNY